MACQQGVSLVNVSICFWCQTKMHVSMRNWFPYACLYSTKLCVHGYPTTVRPRRMVNFDKHLHICTICTTIMDKHIMVTKHMHICTIMDGHVMVRFDQPFWSEPQFPPAPVSRCARFRDSGGKRAGGFHGSLYVCGCVRTCTRAGL